MHVGASAALGKVLGASPLKDPMQCLAELWCRSGGSSAESGLYENLHNRGP